LCQQLGGVARDSSCPLQTVARSNLLCAARTAGPARRMTGWVKVGPLSDLSEDDVRRFDFGERTFAIYRAGGEVYASDGLCTHEQAHLCDGLVMDHVIECPMHN